jgi:hypothetical protein
LAATALLAPAQAGAGDGVGWNDLRPPNAAEENPLERLTPQQVDWIGEIASGRLIQPRVRTIAAEASGRHEMLSAAQPAQGMDAEERLRRRDALIAPRRKRR